VTAVTTYILVKNGRVAVLAWYQSQKSLTKRMKHYIGHQISQTTISLIINKSIHLHHSISAKREIALPTLPPSHYTTPHNTAQHSRVHTSCIYKATHGDICVIQIQNATTALVNMTNDTEGKREYLFTGGRGRGQGINDGTNGTLPAIDRKTGVCVWHVKCVFVLLFCLSSCFCSAFLCSSRRLR
jgi:hypothetical protein